MGCVMKFLMCYVLLLLSETVACAIVKRNSEGDMYSSKLVKLPLNRFQKFQKRLLRRRDEDVFFDLKNQQNFYSVKINVGTPGQDITVLLDTGSSDLWVPSSENPFCEHSSQNKEEVNRSFETVVRDSTGTRSKSRTSATLNCREYGTFNPNRSSTFRSNDTRFSVSYGDSSFADGIWGHDSVNIGNISLTNISFGVATEANSSVGIMGIGLPNLEDTFTGVDNVKKKHTYKYLNFPMKLKAQGLIEKNVYSVFLNRRDASEGGILFGAVDHSKYSGQLYTIPLLNLYKHRGLKDPLQLEVTLQGIGIKMGNTTNTTSITPVPALLDSGTTLVYLPKKMLSMLANQLHAEWEEEVGYYYADCSTLTNTNLYFDFGGFNIVANLSTYVIGRNGKTNRCLLGIQEGNSDSAILGDFFMQNAYIVFDLEDFEVSMAQANYDGGEEQLEVVSKSVPGAKNAPGYYHTFSKSRAITSGGDIFHSSTSYSTNSGSSTKGRAHNGAANMAPASMLTLFLHLVYSFLL